MVRFQTDLRVWLASMLAGLTTISGAPAATMVEDAALAFVIGEEPIRSPSDRFLPAGQPGDDGRESVHVWLVSNEVGPAPSHPARLEIFDELVHGPDDPDDS